MRPADSNIDSLIGSKYKELRLPRLRPDLNKAKCTGRSRRLAAGL